MDTDLPQWTAGPEDKTDSGVEAPASTAATLRARGPEERPSRARFLGILLFGFFMFIFFLAMKLPEARIQNLVIAHLRILAQEQGYLFSAEKVRVGLLLGPSLKMTNVELKSLENDRLSMKIDYLKIRPKLFSMLSSVKKIGLTAELLGGSISGTVGGSSAGAVSVDLGIDTLDLGAATLLKKLLPVEISAKIDGTVRLELDSLQPQNSEGNVKLRIDKVLLPAQGVAFGFLTGVNLPKVEISESNINIALAAGQFTVKEFEVGKEGKNDDIVGKLTGDGTLNRMLDRSTINAKASFGLSAALKQKFPWVDVVLGNARQQDGKYAYQIRGSLSGLEAVPGQ